MEDANAPATTSNGWRMGLTLAGLALGALPLSQRQWTVAAVAGTVGLLVVGGWRGARAAHDLRVWRSARG